MTISDLEVPALVGVAWGLGIGVLLAMSIVFAGLGRDAAHDRRIVRVLATGGALAGVTVGVFVHLLGA